MSFYPCEGVTATLPPAVVPAVVAGQPFGSAARPSWLGVGLPAGVVAVRAAGLVATATPDGPGALVACGAGNGPLVTGELVAFCQVVALAPAVVGPDGRVTVDGWLPEHVRLGLLEAHAGDGVLDQVVAEKGKRPGERRRVMSLELVARLVLAMTLIPTSYVDVMAQLAGLLPQLPWQRHWQVPCSTVFTDWRRRLGVDAMRELFARVAGPIVDAATGTRWHGLWVCALDGFQARVPDTPANRAAFGSSGTSDDTAPFPQVRAVLASMRAGRAVLGAAMDASRVGEQTLTRRLVKGQPDLFGPDRVYLIDRNFLGYHLIEAIHRCGAQLVMRVKSDVRLHFIRWLPDGSYLAYLNSPDRRCCLLLRVVEYDVTLPEGASELFCLATTLRDHQQFPAGEVADLYKQRWSASETTIGENKSTITDAGPSRGPILRSEEPDLAYQELWAWLAATQLVRKAAHAAALTTTGVSTDQISFTTMRREATRSLAQSLVTTTTSAHALAAAADRAARAVLANLVVTNRDRHSPRRQKHKPRFPHTNTTTPTTHGPLPVNLSRPPAPPDTS